METTYVLHIPAHEDASPRWKQLRRDMVQARQAQSFTGHTIDALQEFHDRLGYWPKLVFDRGFGNESIVTHLNAEGCIFYIRMKAGRQIEFDGHHTQLQELTEKDAVVQLCGLPFRVVRSPKSRRVQEPWYILTNDLTSSQSKIVRIYYHPTSLKMVLWLVFLGIALLYHVRRPTKQNQQTTSPKKYVSWIREAYEQLQRELTSYRGLTGLTPCQSYGGQV